MTSYLLGLLCAASVLCLALCSGVALARLRGTASRRRLIIAALREMVLEQLYARTQVPRKASLDVPTSYVCVPYPQFALVGDELESLPRAREIHDCPMLLQSMYAVTISPPVPNSQLLEFLQTIWWDLDPTDPKYGAFVLITRPLWFRRLEEQLMSQVCSSAHSLLDTVQSTFGLIRKIPQQTEGRIPWGKKYSLPERDAITQVAERMVIDALNAHVDTPGEDQVLLHLPASYMSRAVITANITATTGVAIPCLTDGRSHGFVMTRNCRFGPTAYQAVWVQDGPVSRTLAFTWGEIATMRPEAASS